MKIGDIVKVVGVPNGLKGETKSLFELCVGRTFPVFEIVPAPDMGTELLGLHVGEVLDEPDYSHAIWIEKELVTSLG